VRMHVVGTLRVGDACAYEHERGCINYCGIMRVTSAECTDDVNACVAFPPAAVIDGHPSSFNSSTGNHGIDH